MKKLILLTVTIILLSSFQFIISGDNINKTKVNYTRNDLVINSLGDNYLYQKVYVCLGKYAKRYYLYLYCDGLDGCKGEIVSMSKSEAERIGRTLCSRCRKIRDNKK